MTVVRTIELFFQEGRADKLWRGSIVDEGGTYSVRVAWGRRGLKLNEGAEAVRVTLDEATRKLEALVRAKQARGYRELTADDAPAEVAPPARDRPGRAKVGAAAQLLTPIDEDELPAFLADDEMIAQQKIDGIRVLAHIGPDILATNRAGQRSAMNTAAVAGVRALPHGTILDGELVDDAYWVFDVLELAGRDVRGEGYVARYHLLEGLAPLLTGEVHVLPIAVGREAKQALHDRLRAAGTEGIVFKRRDAPYTAGRGTTQRKYKFLHTADVVIVANTGNAYRMAVHDDGRLVPCGKVFAGTTNASRAVLDAALARGEQPVCEVRYLYATEDEVLFQCVFVRVRDDKPAAECVRAQLHRTSRAIVM